MRKYDMRATHIHQIRGQVALVCCECGKVWTDEEKQDKGSFANHMVEVHGYKRAGAQIFKSRPCVACPKPGLYKVGNLAYCKDHLNLATERRVVVVKMFAGSGDDEQQRRMIAHDRAVAFDRHNNRRK